MCTPSRYTLITHPSPQTRAGTGSPGRRIVGTESPLSRCARSSATDTRVYGVACGAAAFRCPPPRDFGTHTVRFRRTFACRTQARRPSFPDHRPGQRGPSEPRRPDSDESSLLGALAIGGDVGAVSAGGLLSTSGECGCGCCRRRRAHIVRHAPSQPSGQLRDRGDELVKDARDYRRAGWVGARRLQTDGRSGRSL